MENLEILWYIVFAIMLIGLFSFAGVAAYNFGMEKQRKRNQIYGILTCLKGSQKPSEVPIELEGDAQDSMLNTTVLANKLISKCGEKISVLVFTSVIYHRDTESIQQILTLLQHMSLLDMNIDWVNDSVFNTKTENIITLLTKLTLRCDTLLNSSDISVRMLKDYDVIFHPKAGMKGSYETVARVIRMLCDGSTNIPE